MSNEAIIEKFYQSMANRDVEGMISCYHPEVQFEDPAFGVLKGERACDMWRMLFGSKKVPIQVTFSQIQANEQEGSAHWTAEYVFRQTGKKVYNVINAQFTFKDGKIYKHKDHFDLYKWAQQAFGFTGFLMGWTNFFKQKLQKKTKENLNFFIQKQ
jgi:ketosteroid isomerase-like protein